MGSGQRGSSVTIREDLKEAMMELDFSDVILAADIVAPTAPVTADVGRYPTFPRENILRYFDTRRHRDGSYSRGLWEWGDDSYITYEYGFEEVIDNVSALRDAAFIDHEVMSSKLAYHNLVMARESRVASALLNTTTFTGATNTTSITNEWDDATNATPWADIDGAAKKIRAKSALSKSVLTVILSEDLIDYAIRSDEVKDFVKYTSNNAEIVARSNLQARANWLASYFGVMRVVPTLALYDTAKWAQSSSTMGKFWSNEYIFVGYIPTGPMSIQTPSAIKQLVWTRYSNDFVAETYDEDKYNQRVVRAREYRGIKVNTDFGHLLTNAKTTVSNGI